MTLAVEFGGEGLDGRPEGAGFRVRRTRQIDVGVQTSERARIAGPVRGPPGEGLGSGYRVGIAFGAGACGLEALALELAGLDRCGYLGPVRIRMLVCFVGRTLGYSPVGGAAEYRVRLDLWLG